MKQQVVYILIFLGFTNATFACSCHWFDTEARKQELFDNSDYVIKGHPIQNVNPDFDPNDKRRIGKIGKDILFKVDTVYKGTIISDTLLIIQGENNCSVYFYENGEYWIFGNVVKKIDLYNEEIDNGGGYDFKDKTFRVSGDNQLLDKYRALSKKYVTINTSGCVAFMSHHTDMIDFIWRKKN